jgi:hypothetical protein
MNNFKIAYIAYLTTMCLGILGGVTYLFENNGISSICFIVAGLSAFQIHINVRKG